jgi:hypothetical protein
MVPGFLQRFVSLFRKPAIPGWVLVAGSVIWKLWAGISNISVLAWLYGLIPDSWKQVHMPTVSPWGPFSMLIAGLVWLAILAFVPRGQGLIARGGKVTAYGEVRHPFPTSDRDPRVTIEFDKSPAPMGEDTGFRDRAIFLCNDGGIDAFKVQVSQISLTVGRAKFDEIPQIRPNHKERVTVVILGPTGEDIAPFAVHDLELLMVAEIRTRSDASDWSPLETDCNITYEDHSERRFITYATLSHDMLKGLSSAKNYKFREFRLVKDSWFKFLKRRKS